VNILIFTATAASAIFLSFSSYAEPPKPCSLGSSSLIAWDLYQAMHFLKVYKVPKYRNYKETHRK